MGVKIKPSENQEKKIPEEFKKLAKDFSEKGFITTSSKKHNRQSSCVSRNRRTKRRNESRVNA